MLCYFSVRKKVLFSLSNSFFALVYTWTNAVVVKFQLQNMPRFYTPLYDKIYFAGSVNGWVPNDENYQFDPLTKSLTIDFKNVHYVEFKITRGSWDTTETWADGTPRTNRQLRLVRIERRTRSKRLKNIFLLLFSRIIPK